MARVFPFIQKLVVCTCCFVVGAFTWHVIEVPVDDSTAWTAIIGASTSPAYVGDNDGAGESPGANIPRVT